MDEGVSKELSGVREVKVQTIEEYVTEMVRRRQNEQGSADGATDKGPGCEIHARD